jgi:hypothetical protein
VGAVIAAARVPHHNDFYSLEASATFEPSPCSTCQYARQCETKKTACMTYYNYVQEKTNDDKNNDLRARAIYNAIDHERGEREVQIFFNAITKAQQSRKTGIFYDYDSHHLRVIKKCRSRYKEITQSKYYFLVGFFGPGYSEQEIANYIEKRLSQCLH